MDMMRRVWDRMMRQNVSIVIFSMLVTPVSEQKITCDVSKSNLKNDTKLTCYFPEDISLTKRNIQVIRLKSNSGERTILLDCKWHDDEPLCFVKPGISFDRNITKRISIEIPGWPTHEAENESYKCEFSLPGLTKVAPCSFSQDTGGTITCNVVKTNSERYTQMTCHFPEDVGLTKKNLQVIQLNGTNMNSKILLDCKWLDEKPFCFTESELSFDRNITDRITIIMPSPPSDDAKSKSYKCDLSSSGQFIAKPCTFVGDPDEEKEEEEKKKIMELFSRNLRPLVGTKKRAKCRVPQHVKS